MGTHNFSNTFTIMIVNDNPTGLRQMKQLVALAYQNSHIVAVEDYQETITKVLECRPDILLLDLESEDIKVQIIQLMKTLRIETNIIFAGNMNQKLLNTCLSNGVTGYVFTPIDAESMLKTIEDIVDGMPHDQLNVVK